MKGAEDYYVERLNTGIEIKDLKEILAQHKKELEDIILHKMVTFDYLREKIDEKDVTDFQLTSVIICIRRELRKL